MPTALLALPSCLLPLLLLELLHLVLLFTLRIPLPRLQDQDAHQHKRQDRIARRQDPQAVFPPNSDIGIALLLPVNAKRHNSQPLDDVGDVHDDAHDVQNQRRAVEEEVRLGRLEELDEEAEEADGDGDVQDARDERRRGVDELQVRFQLVIVRGGGFVRRPQEGVVVGEGGKEHAEEEACCWSASAGEVCEGWRHLRPMIMKVAKELDPPCPFGLS